MRNLTTTYLLLIAISLNFLIINKTSAQEQLKHDIKYYLSDDGKLYWNKKLPVYIRISPNPTDSGLLMKSEITKQYTNPYYFDTEGKNKIRSRWATDQETGKTIMPQMEVIWEVYVDGIAPNSNLNFLKSTKYFNGKNTYYGSDILFNIESKDANSGIDKIYYSLNEDSYMPLNQELNFKFSGKQTVKYYAVDNVGNVETPKENTFFVDNIPPKTYYTITGISNNEIIAVSTKIYLTAEDSLSGVSKTYYKIDDGKEILYQSGTNIPISNLNDGEHKLNIYSIDKVNNKEEETTVKFYLDKTGPIIASDILGDRYLMGDKTFFSGRTKMKLTAVDNKSGVDEIFYSVDGSEFTKYDQPFYLPSIPGVHIVKYFATDKMQNNSEGKLSKYEKYKHVVSRIYVDLTGPILSHQFIGPKYISRDTIYINNETKIELSGKDIESGIKEITYTIDNQAEEISYKEPFQVKNQGFHHLVYYGYDNVNNRNRAELSFDVDSVGPDIKYNFSIEPLGIKDSLDVYPQHVILYLGATDKVIGAKELFYSINNGAFKTYLFSVKGFIKNSVNKVDIKAKDYLNNETSLELEFYIE
ncbi:MAG: hypothetical protein JXR51_14225 [Bacteroidales bacterium]|nr:hypothetical protein [Bacteroidales bacterium]MBN2758326.1 hypothetical protein [Bacteroidales bacterium]